MMNRKECKNKTKFRFYNGSLFIFTVEEMNKSHLAVTLLAHFVSLCRFVFAILHVTFVFSSSFFNFLAFIPFNLSVCVCVCVCVGVNVYNFVSFPFVDDAKWFTLFQNDQKLLCVFAFILLFFFFHFFYH